MSAELFDEDDNYNQIDEDDVPSKNNMREDEKEFVDGDEEDDNDDPFVAAGINKNRNTWIAGGTIKNEIVRELIKYFGSMIESSPKMYAIPDHNGRYKPEDMKHEKLLDASKYVLKARSTLVENENFDTRDFTIFIANKRWVKNIIRPLLELCAKDDNILAMRCCVLLLVLIRRLSDSSLKVLKDYSSKKQRKASSQDLQLNEEAKEDDEKGPEGTTSGKNQKEINNIITMKTENVKLQISALLSFKDALCSEKCNEAISNAFKDYWLKEQLASTEDNKKGVAICFAYFRRILAIEPHRHWSLPGEILVHRTLHDKYIVQLRLLLSVIPNICSDILRSYHNDWLGDIILIIYFAIKDFEVKELFRVWKTGALIEDFENIESAEDIVDTEGLVKEPNTISSRKEKTFPLQTVVLPEALVASNRSDTIYGKGQLKQLLQKDRNNRQLSLNAGHGSLGSSRFKGVYQRSVSILTTAQPNTTTTTGPGITGTSNNRVNLATTATTSTKGRITSQPNNTTTTTEDVTIVAPKCIPQYSRILHDPFADNIITALPKQPTKRNKKNLTFALDTSNSALTQTQYALGEDHQKAAVVVATLVNLLSNEISLKPFVKRINEDLRRDEMRVGPELELRYFEILAKVLHYHRLKLAEDYSKVQQNSNILGKLWEPNMKNVMDALDKMSFTRVIVSIERMSKSVFLTNPNSSSIITIDDLVVPITLYKEMVCYLRVLLESSLDGHHEIAIAALWRLFYASSDRLDPLPKLLSSWKPGTYPRSYLNTLVELVHETLSTLTAAQNRFTPVDMNVEEWARKKYKRKGKTEMDLEQYVLACLRFKVDDYYKKIASNQSVRMYTKLLSHYNENDPATNHYIYGFLRRLCSFTLEQEFKTNPGAGDLEGEKQVRNKDSNTLSSSDEVNLGYMLFNIHSLEVFSNLLNDHEVYQNKSLEPLVRLVQYIVRRFGEAVDKNHMLFVEALFQHPRPHEHCCSIDNVYEATSYASYIRAAHSRHMHSSDAYTGRNDDHSSNESSDNDSDSSRSNRSNHDHDGEDEFDDTLQPTHNNPLPSKKDTQKKIMKSSSRSGGLRDNSSRIKQTPSTHNATKLPSRLQKKSRVSLMSRLSKNAWSKEEDDVLTEQFAIYAGSASVFTSIAQHPSFTALGKNRTEAQISNRVRFLNLHNRVVASSDEFDSDHDSERNEFNPEDQEDNHRTAPTTSAVKKDYSPTLSEAWGNDSDKEDDMQYPATAGDDMVTQVDEERFTSTAREDDNSDIDKNQEQDTYPQHIELPKKVSSHKKPRLIREDPNLINAGKKNAWDSEEEDPEKVARFKNSVLNNLDINEYDDDNDENNNEVQLSNKKKKGLVKGVIANASTRKRNKNTYTKNDSDSERVVNNSVAITNNDDINLNKKRQLVIDSDED